jgi:DNA-binding response OmpR family regulator/DNA-binding CsgD family transcriptional regulator
MKSGAPWTPYAVDNPEVVPAPRRRDVVLIIDDSPQTLGFVSRALEEAGLTALAAPDGNSALELVKRVVPDVILLDAVMPGLDGFETCRALKQGPAAHVPVIFMTGLVDSDDVVRGLESGGVDYVNKPLVLASLLARIRVHLNNARREQGARVALDATGRTLLALKPDGSVMWQTPQAQAMLKELAPQADVHNRLFAWLNGAQASVQALDLGVGGVACLRLRQVGRLSGDEILVAIERVLTQDASDLERCERLAKRFKLTPREAEVLLWASRGKSNRDIGEILTLSPRTVNKHLEHIYIKMGVESRAAAAALAASQR